MEPKIKELIDLFLSGNISEKQSGILHNWIKKDNNESVFREYVYKYYRDYKIDLDRAFGKIEARIDKPISKSIKTKVINMGWLRYAAVVVGILFTIIAVFRFKNVDQKLDSTKITLELEDGSFKVLEESKDLNVVVDYGEVLVEQSKDQISYKGSGKVIDNIAINTLRIPNGKRFRLQLSDGSDVILNSGSKITYPVHFIKGSPRRVSLEGEAYFKVAKNTQSAFIVNAKGLNTEVFGTEFNVSSYNNDDFTEVVLIEGSVGIFEKGDRFSEHDGVKLKPSEMVYKSADTLKVEGVDVRNHVAWTQGKLFFNSEDFGSIVRKIERHFDVAITNNYKALEAKKFTGKFNSESVEQILTTFQKTNNFNYIIENNTITINP